MEDVIDVTSVDPVVSLPYDEKKVSEVSAGRGGKGTYISPL